MVEVAHCLFATGLASRASEVKMVTNMACLRPFQGNEADWEKKYSSAGFN